MNPEIKICSKCGIEKELPGDFYMCSGIYRSECKKCTIRVNGRYQSDKKIWLNRGEEHKEYMRKYRAENKEKFAAYRRAHKERDPDYWKKYFKKRRETK